MTCPFLREAGVKYCRAASVRKLIPQAQRGPAEEKCSSDAHANCPVFQEQAEEAATASGACPFLCESLMQYCGAAPVAKFVPYSESLLSRCGNDSHRYCELYFSMAHPSLPSEDVEGLKVPKSLEYSPNHLWIDVSEEGICHLGIDALLSRALGPVERITYVWQKGVHRPAAVLTAGGLDFEVMFPNELLLTSCNLYLRSEPARLTGEPYTSGWLFEGQAETGTLEGLRSGADVRPWVESELHRINEFLQEQTSGGSLAADGGLFVPGLVRCLERDQALGLYHEFFSPFAGGK